MPLLRGKSRKTIAANIATEIRHGRSPSQAAAIAYSLARSSKSTPQHRGDAKRERAQLRAELKTARERVRAAKRLHDDARRAVPATLARWAATTRRPHYPMTEAISVLVALALEQKIREYAEHQRALDAARAHVAALEQRIRAR